MTERRRRVVELAARLDTAELPLDGAELPDDATSRALLDQLLARRGRVVVEVDLGTDQFAVTSGLADDVAAELADIGVGTLSTNEAAALGLVLLRCVAEAAASGRPPVAWHLAERVPHQLLKASRIPNAHLRDALRALHRAGLVAAAPAGVRPGPALSRLTPVARQRLERRVVELVAGSDPLIQRVLDNVAAATESTTADDGSAQEPT